MKKERMKILKVGEDVELLKFLYVVGRNVNIFNFFGKLVFFLFKYIILWFNNFILLFY